MEHALANAAEWEGPILVHVLTQKGRGYAPAEEDEVQRLHDFKVQPNIAAPDLDVAPITYTDAFTRAMLDVAATTARGGGPHRGDARPTGLLPFEQAYPERFLDVGIAEQHAVTAAAGMAMAGLRPIVAVYSTFFSRAFDQANLDVGLHKLPVVFVLDRAGITGDDGPEPPRGARPGPGAVHSRHDGVRAVVLARGAGHARHGLVARRAVHHPVPEDPSPSCRRRRCGVRTARPDWCARATARCASWPSGKMVEAAEEAASKLAADGVDVTVWDVRVVAPPDPAMLRDAARHGLVVTVEDGIRVGGAGSFLVDAMRQPRGARATRAGRADARACRVRTSSKGGPTGSWPSSGSTVPASPPR